MSEDKKLKYETLVKDKVITERLYVMSTLTSSRLLWVNPTGSSLLDNIGQQAITWFNEGHNRRQKTDYWIVVTNFLSHYLRQT